MKASDHQELTYNPRMHHAAPVRKTLSSVLCLQVYLPIACQTPAEGVIGYTSLTDHPMRFSLFSPVTSFLNVRSHIRAQGLQGVVDWRVCMETHRLGRSSPRMQTHMLVTTVCCNLILSQHQSCMAEGRGSACIATGSFLFHGACP